jgi:ribosome maturation factor RimP
MGISPTDVESLAAPLAAAAGMDLEGVTVEKVGRRDKLSVVVDADGGVDLDAVAELSTALSAALDEDSSIGESPYVLEVTSPGVDRPLQLPRHWRRAKDRLVAVELADGGSMTGRVLGSDETSAELEVNGSVHTVPFVDVVRAIVQIEFDRKDP